MYANRTYGHANASATVHAYEGSSTGSGHNAYRSVVPTFDHATSTLTVEVPLATFNEAAAEACPTCAPIGRGTVFRGVTASTIAWITVHTGALAGSGYLGYSNVDTTGTADYTVGS